MWIVWDYINRSVELCTASLDTAMEYIRIHSDFEHMCTHFEENISNSALLNN